MPGSSSDEATAEANDASTSPPEPLTPTGSHFDSKDKLNDTSDFDDESSLPDSASSLGPNKREQVEKDNIYRDALAGEETRTIRQLKCMLIVFLLFLAASIFAVVYKYTANVEQEEFENEFLEQGTKLVSGFSSDSYQKMQALESLSKALTLRNETWPFVTISDSHDLFQPFLSLANAASIKILPIVRDRQRVEWEAHTAATQGWVEEDLNSQQAAAALQQGGGGGGGQRQLSEEESTSSSKNQEEQESSSYSPLRQLQYFEADDDHRVSPFIKNYVGVDTSPELWLPWWQYAPVIPNKWFLNFNQLADGEFYRDFQVMYETKKAIIAKTETYLPGLDFQSTRDFTFTQELLAAGGYGQYESGEPIGFIHYPVFRSKEDDEIVAVVSATVYWKTYFQDILPESTKGVICVVENDIQTFTYRIDGTTATFLGMSDLHDPVYDEMEIATAYKSFESDYDQSRTESNSGRRYTGVPVDETRLAYRIRVYPSAEMQEPFSTSEPWLYASIAAAIMLLSVFIFLVYDCYVERRQSKVSNVAVKSNAIVSSLFPASVKDKLFQERDGDTPATTKTDAFKVRHNKNAPFLSPGGSNQKKGVMTLNGEAADDSNSGWASPSKKKLGGINYMDFDDEDLRPDSETDPIADFFPSATVLFMDIAGFTAWSSSREPSQVFTLLETIYRSFDRIATRRRVFKVETIGDCYVACCGLPEPCANHAPVMAMFALDCMKKMNQLAHRLEPKLGPDTGDLTVRVGIHSGPVTAGVLRGERARFQLFGDTVNTASRVESTGKAGMIQVSQDTAELLFADGKSSWVRKRSDSVQAKGKGELRTFWLLPKPARSAVSLVSATSSKEGGGKENSGEDAIEYMRNASALASGKDTEMERALKTQRLVKFNYDLLLNILKEIAAKHSSKNRVWSFKNKASESSDSLGSTQKGASCLDEVVEIIELPNFNHQASDTKKKAAISTEAKSQLRAYCENIAKCYHDNPFHNFEHACHVIQSSSKLLSRIVAVKEIGNMAEAHDTTFGITSDPLTQFAVIFAAMIHDADHRGVPNSTLAKEEPAMAELYQHHAIAEQNSVAMAWDLLMEPQFKELRTTICRGETELKRFRQLIVNCLMATDIFDKHLKAIREERWEHAFQETLEEDLHTSTNRKATIVIEHIIQASDVSHTMQHWHVYKKWNEKLFFELYKAYKEGRATEDPAKGWYKGELWFFDNYVIPLAEKLEECGVFGVSSDEYIMYARGNRQEWEKKGEAIVKENLKKFEMLEAQEKKKLPEELPIS